MSVSSLPSTNVPSADAPMKGRQHCSLVVKRPLTRVHHRVATLGPAGTSSEAAGTYLAASLSPVGPAPVELHPSYEEACAAVIAGHAARLLVANAYQDVNAST